MNEAETKLARARTKLIMDKPFLGALVLRLHSKAAKPKWCQTTATDAKSFYYNAEYIEALNVQEIQFVLAHEALHCALSHFARRQHRNKQRWDLACDYAINPILLEEGLTAPPGVWIPEDYLGMTAEEIYPLIKPNNSDEPMDKHVYDDQNQKPAENQGSDLEERNPNQDETKEADSTPANEKQPEASQPPPLTDMEKQNLDTQWQQRLAGATQQAMQAGKLGGTMARMVEYFLQPQLPWRMLLARYISVTARNDYSYMRPSKREGTAIFPSQHSEQLNIVVALDTSGSIHDEEIAQCVAEIDAIKGQMRAKITLLACDAEMAKDSPWSYEPWEEFVPPRKFIGGGGTSFKPVFEYVDKEMQPPDLLIYFTDADGEFPDQMPYYPIIWLIKGKKSVPWGQRIQLN
ncbi:MAG: VWA-like domain-containing protein [Candidatus Marithrix sp.]